MTSEIDELAEDETSCNQSVRSMTVWAFFCAAATWGTCRFHPYGQNRTSESDFGFPWVDAWTLLQALCISLVALVVFRLIAKRNVGWSRHLPAFAMFLIPTITLVNVICVAWIGRRALSYETILYFIQHGNAVLGHVPAGAWKLMVGGGIGLIVFGIVGGYLAHRSGRFWQSTSRSLTPKFVTAACLGILGLVSSPIFVGWPDALAQMRRDHSRHPLVVFGLVDSEPPVFTSSAPNPSVVPRGMADEMKRRIAAKDRRLNQLKRSTKPEGDTFKRDVLVVVIESMRRELIDPDVMPNLSEYATSGIHCLNHFSGGNATTHGMFSLFNGVDAVWYSFAIRNDPLMMRLFREAGYEVGFFAGHDDWRKFRMEGFINHRVFDVFQTSPRRWLSSDRQATELAASFLNADPESRKPRLAVLYLYSTHADYHSYANDQVFQPAAEDGFLIPYSQSMREKVWKRYKNSARSIDGLLAGVLRKDRVIVVTGDHGESFLEDGVCGHGTKLNEYQNGTPAVIHVPEILSRQISQPTSHADLLPTILDAVGLTISDENVFDGHSLLDPLPSDRVVLTRNYLDNECLLIGIDKVSHRFEIATSEWRTRFIPDEHRAEKTESDFQDPQKILARWINSRLSD